MGKRRIFSPRLIEDARELYVANGGLNHELIEREMRARGWDVFRRQHLIDRVIRGRALPGLIREFGWEDLVPERSSRAKCRPVAKRHDLQLWLQDQTPQWSWHWKYQRFIYRALHRLSLGKIKRLMVFMPPRHGKSELVTVRYAAYRMIRDPSLNVILGSYNQSLANRFSRKIRRIVDEHAELETLRDGGDISQVKKTNRSRSVADWETGKSGGLRAVGVGGGIAGFGAGLVVIDDPVKNRAEAESKTYRDRVSDWFKDDIYTRLEPDGAIILIQTRWHEDDLAGRLLNENEEGGECWEVVRLPAIAEEDVPTESARSDGMAEPFDPPGGEAATNDYKDVLGRRPGEALCPQRFDEKALQRIKRKLGSYSFASLYQQRPQLLEGGLFKRDWFTIVDAAPEGLRWARGYDLAVSTKTSADYTASVRCGTDYDGNIYISDAFRARIEFPEQRKYIVERITDEYDTRHGIEKALHGQAFVQDLLREAQFLNRSIKAVRVDRDKVTRANAWSNRAEAGKVFLVRGAWNDEFIAEASTFPNGRHDDQVDAASIAIGLLAEPENFAYCF
jgi:predicted phage terminase large subunit-like protein